MKADALPITKLYDTLNKAYVIPSYQRPFAWDSDKSVELLESILDDASAGAKLTSLGTFLFCNVPYAPGQHPFGNNAPHSDAPNTVWEVVDGQQRMTVLAIIGYALKLRLITLTATGLAYSAPLEYEQFYRTSRKISGKGVPAIIRDGDHFDNGYKSDLSRLLNSFIGNTPYPPTEIGNRLTETVDAITDWVNKNLDAISFPKFSDYFLINCQYVQVEADDQDSAFSMFEPLNSTSAPLTAFEIYRSKTIRKIFPNPTFAETLKLLDYDNAVREVVTRHSNQLIFSCAQTYSGERPKINLVRLKQYLDSHVNPGFVDFLESGAKFLNSVWSKQELSDSWFDDDTKNCIRFLNASRHEAAMPVIMRYYQLNPGDVPDVVKTIVAFYALWRPAFPTNSLPEIYRGLLSSGSPDNIAYSGGVIKSVPDLKSYFRSKLEIRLGVPAIGQTYQDLWIDDSKQTFLTYESLKTICRLFIFLDIGQSIKSNLVPDDPWTVTDDIEHIYASSIQPSIQGVHKIGNLTFLPPTINRSIQNMAWDDKKEVYQLLGSTSKINPPPRKFADGRDLPISVQNYLASPQSQAMAHLNQFISEPMWGDNQIDARSKSMLKRVWAVLYKKWLN